MMVNIDIARNLIENAHYVDNDANENKEENTMTQSTFTTKLGNTFTANATGTYFYMIDTKGKKIRIKKREYEQAQREYELQCKKDAEQEQAELDEQPSKVEVDTDLEKPAMMDQYGGVDCRDCNVTHCVHRNCMRRNPKAVGGLGECPRLTVKLPEHMEELDAAAEDPNVSLEQFCEMLSEDEKATIEPAEAELLNNTRKEKKTKKAARKPRKSKDIAYEGHGITLTAKQVDFIHHLPDTCFWENGLDSAPWTDVLADEIGGQFEGKPMTTGAMISTICEKGLATRGKAKVNGKKATYMALTDLGKEVAKELGLE